MKGGFSATEATVHTSCEMHKKINLLRRQKQYLPQKQPTVEQVIGNTSVWVRGNQNSFAKDVW